MLRAWLAALALLASPLFALAGPAGKVTPSKPPAAAKPAAPAAAAAAKPAAPNAAPAKPAARAAAAPAKPTAPAKPAAAAAASTATAVAPETLKAAKDFLASWVAAQNQGNFAAYEAMYAPGFTGTKRVGKVQKTFDREGWLQDRKSMFRAAMLVEATELVVTGAPPIITLELTQRWEQGTFADVGTKRLVIDVYRSADPILREDMLSSRKALARQACLMALYPEARGGRIGADKTAAKVLSIEPLELGSDGTACRIDVREPDAEGTQVVLAALASSALKEHKRAGGWVELGRQSYTFEDEKQGSPDDPYFSSKESVDIWTFQIGPQKRALWVEQKREEGGNMHSLRKSEVGIWRITREGLDDLLSFASTDSGGEEDSSHTCTLSTLEKARKGYFDLELECVSSQSNWHAEDPDQQGTTESTETTIYRWDGDMYLERL